MKPLALGFFAPVLLTVAACSNEASNQQPKPALSAADQAAQDAAARDAAQAAKDKEAADRALNASRNMSLDNFAFPVVHFSYDSADIDEQSRKDLEKVAGHLAQSQNVHILIAGHCDERGTSEYNLALGENRAKAVRKYLSLLGVSPDRLDTVSFGSAQPIAQGQTEADYAQNRRAEFSPKKN